MCSHDMSCYAVEVVMAVVGSDADVGTDTATCIFSLLFIFGINIHQHRHLFLSIYGWPLAHSLHASFLQPNSAAYSVRVGMYALNNMPKHQNMVKPKYTNICQPDNNNINIRHFFVHFWLFGAHHT